MPVALHRGERRFGTVLAPVPCVPPTACGRMGEDEAGDSSSDEASGDSSGSADASDASADQSGDTAGDKGDASDAQDAASTDSGASGSAASASSDPNTSAEVEAAEQAVANDAPWYIKVLDAFFFYQGVEGQTVSSTGN